MFCKHIRVAKYDEDIGMLRYFCDAYPEGVPRAVKTAGHFFSKPGDNGIQFELMTGCELPDFFMRWKDEEEAVYAKFTNIT